MLWLVFLVFSEQTTDVTGLHAGESAVVVDATNAFDPTTREQFLHPRVLDATTGAPVAGVVIETWTEAGVEPFRYELRIDASITGRDGSACTRFVEGLGRSDKVRLSKAGYASRVISTSDAYHEEVRLYPASPLTGRVLDLDGSPVSGALVRTRQSCAHAVPATQTRTDAFGRFELQDCPALGDDSAELEVVDARHGPLYQLDLDDLRSQRSLYGALDLYVARQRPVTLELVDAHGEPMVGRCVTTKEAPVTRAWTDESGRCTLLPSSTAFEGTYFLGDSPEASEMLVANFVDGLVARVTPGMREGVDRSDKLTVRIDGMNENDLAPPIVIVPSRACFFEAKNGEQAEVPRGSARVCVGGDFSGWRKEVRDVVITAMAQEIVFSPRREPRVTIDTTQWVDVRRVIVQAGDDSNPNADFGCGAGSGEWCFPVPSGQPITIFAERFDGAQRRVNWPPIEADTTVDFDADSSLVRDSVSHSPEANCVVRLNVVDAAGKRLSAAQASVITSSSEFESLDGVDGEFRWPMSAHTMFRAGFDVPGYTHVEVEGLAIASGASLPTKIVMTQRARVQLRGNVREVEVGGSEPESTTEGIVLDVAAGPLTLCVQRNDKPDIALDLLLAPGETRVLDVR